MSYAKTNWQNLPNTTTPVNATNMNKVESQLEKLNSDFIHGVLTGDYTIASTHEYVTIPFLNNYQLGSNMSISNGEITIGNNISVVKVACTLAFSAGSTAENKFMRVKKNDTVAVIQRVASPANGVIQIVLTPFIIPVSNGDKIKIEVYGTNTDVLVGGSRTNCLVEKVE